MENLASLISTLSSVERSLFIPLSARFFDFQKEVPLLKDEKLGEICCAVKPFLLFELKKDQILALNLRAKLFDSIVNGLIDNYGDVNIINLGCGIDTRLWRLRTFRGRWYNLDYENVIKLNQLLLGKDQRVENFATDLTDFTWIKNIPNHKTTVIICEGLSMYLTLDQIKSLLNQLVAHFPHAFFIFDSITPKVAGDRRYSFGALKFSSLASSININEWNPYIKEIQSFYPVQHLRAQWSWNTRARTIFPWQQKGVRIINAGWDCR